MVTICILLLKSHQQKELVVSQVWNNSVAQPPVHSGGLAIYVWLVVLWLTDQSWIPLR